MTTTEIPARIRHLGICGHAQTHNARRICRKALIAAAASPAYAAGDRVDVAGDTIVLTCRKRFSGGGEARWGWLLTDSDTGSARTFPTADQAIADAAAKISGRRCYCGEIATMNGSTRPTCDTHYAA